MRTEVPLNLFKIAQPLTAETIENHKLTPASRDPDDDCRHVVFRYKEKFPYFPGQSVGVIPDGMDPATGKPHKLRLYSVSSESGGDHGDGQTVSLCVVRHFWNNSETGERHIRGIGSNYLCDLKQGDKVLLTGPVGRHFLLPEDFQDWDLIFVATGTGIAPYRGMLRDLFKGGFQGRVRLYFGAKYSDTLHYNDEFESYRNYKNYFYVKAVSREEQNPVPDQVPTREGRMYVQVRMYQDKDVLKDFLKERRSIVYICGLKGMEGGIYPVLEGVGRELGQTDSFVAKLRAEHRLKVEVY